MAADRLREDLWDGNPSLGSLSSLHAHISRLRAVLEPQRLRRGPASVLVSGPAGYVLNASDTARDSGLFESAVQRARQFLAHNRPDEARREVDHALGMWRGGALADAANHAFAAAEIARLEENRLSAEELRATILLHQGQVQEAVAAAEELAARFPLREAVWTLLMQALYLADRPAEALRRYDTVRTLLADQLGIDPGHALRETHQAVLRHDTDALVPWAGQSPAVAADGAQLHAAPTDAADPPTGAASSARDGHPLVGRAHELAKLMEMLDHAASDRTGWALLSGEEGIGRTRLAEEFAARAAQAGFAVAWARCFHGPAAARGGGVFSPAGQLLSALNPDRALCPPPEDTARELAYLLARQPTVCVIDDLHLADEEFRQTLTLFATLLRDLPVVFVCTLPDDTNDTALGEFLALLVRRGGVLTLPLTPLSPADVRELLTRLPSQSTGAARPHGPLDREATKLHRLSCGNPFLLAELLELPAGLRTGPDAQVPASIRRVLKARLDGVGKQVRTLLDTVAVSGSRLDVELITQVSATSREDLLELIDSAVTARLLVWEEDSATAPSGHYWLPELLRQVILGELTTSRKQSLHSALARALAELPGRHPQQAALHLLAAGPLTPREELAAVALQAGQDRAQDSQ